MHIKWLESFKIAFIQEDVDAVSKLLKKIPEFKKIEDMRSAYTLINEAKKKFENEKSNTKQNMDKIEKAKKFLNTKELTSSFDEVY